MRGPASPDCFGLPSFVGPLAMTEPSSQYHSRYLAAIRRLPKLSMGGPTAGLMDR